jgi:hypothetical protein
MGGSSSELLLPTDSGHEGQPQGGENDKGASGVQFCSLPKAERRRTGNSSLAPSGDGVSLTKNGRR